MDDTARATDEILSQLAVVQDRMRAGQDALERQLPALSVSGASPDGAVSLTVNAEGVLTGLRLTDAVRRMSPAEIANTVLRTYADTQRVAARQAAELLVPLGSGGYLQRRIAWRQQFQPELQDEPRVGFHRPPPRLDQDDDGYQINADNGW
jgi:hypothetical protein